MLLLSELKEIFNLYDEELDGKIDGTQIGDVVRAAGLKPTNAMVIKASGQEFKRKGTHTIHSSVKLVIVYDSGEKRLTFEEWLPIYEQLTKEKEQGSFPDFMEGLKVFDKEESGKILAAELRHILLALGKFDTQKTPHRHLSAAVSPAISINFLFFQASACQPMKSTR